MADIVKFPTRRFFITNEERASAALAAVEAFRNVRDSSLYSNGSMREAIGDLIGDLCHLVVRHKIPPFEMNRRRVLCQASAARCISTPMRRARSRCCACAAIGHVTAPPSSVMNSRRFTA